MRYRLSPWLQSEAIPALRPELVNINDDPALMTILRFVRALSTGSTRPPPPVLRAAGVPERLFGAALISSHSPSAACPSGCPGSVGHCCAMLRQQARNMVGRG